MNPFVTLSYEQKRRHLYWNQYHNESALNDFLFKGTRQQSRACGSSNRLFGGWVNNKKEEVKRDFIDFSSTYSFEFFIRKGRHRNKGLNEIKQEVMYYLKHKGRSAKQDEDRLNHFLGV